MNLKLGKIALLTCSLALMIFAVGVPRIQSWKYQDLPNVVENNDLAFHSNGVYEFAVKLEKGLPGSFMLVDADTLGDLRARSEAGEIFSLLGTSPVFIDLERKAKAFNNRYGEARHFFQLEFKKPVKVATIKNTALSDVLQTKHYVLALTSEGNLVACTMYRGSKSVDDINSCRIVTSGYPKALAHNKNYHEIIAQPAFYKIPANFELVSRDNDIHNCRVTVLTPSAAEKRSEFAVKKVALLSPVAPQQYRATYIRLPN